ncbi:aminotransferase DegT [Agaricicola taiwanensis]|uniref:Aminotransferase DegT n=1 Tax=Agaricicola taiwanensis TaxID=591372 RepID=A0A8J2VNN2_9RHOB|nr:aminotransferase DegT [Agaricicola taiwanensis]
MSSAGPEVLALEQSLAQLTGRRFAVATVNGTAAIHLALLSVGILPGDKVIVPDWTFAATANAVAHAGAIPVFVDVNPTDWALSPDLVRQALSDDATIKAVIAVDPVGHAADMDALAAICATAGVPLIEDAAGAIGASYKGRPCGSFGSVSTFSFNGNKTVTAGGGGMVLTDDEEVARRVRHRSTQARPGTDYIHDAVGYNYRMTNLNAAVGLAQMERLSEMVASKRAIAGRYDEALRDRTDMAAMPRPDHSESSCWLYNVRVADEAGAHALVSTLAQEGIESRIFWRSLSAQAPWAGCRTYLSGLSHSLSGVVVSLPCSSSLTDEQQSRVLNAIALWQGAPITREKAA